MIQGSLNSLPSINSSAASPESTHSNQKTQYQALAEEVGLRVINFENATADGILEAFLEAREKYNKLWKLANKGKDKDNLRVKFSNAVNKNYSGEKKGLAFIHSLFGGPEIVESLPKFKRNEGIFKVNKSKVKHPIMQATRRDYSPISLHSPFFYLKDTSQFIYMQSTSSFVGSWVRTTLNNRLLVENLLLDSDCGHCYISKKEVIEIRSHIDRLTQRIPKVKNAIYEATPFPNEIIDIIMGYFDSLSSLVPDARKAIDSVCQFPDKITHLAMEYFGF